MLFRLIQQSLPPGLLGLAIVGLFAALMSTANTMLVVAVAALLSDVVYAGREQLTSIEHVMRTTRRLTWGVGGAGLLVAYGQPQIVTLIQTALWGSGILLPTVIGGLFWPRATARAALASLLVGFPINVALSFTPGFEQTSWMPALAAATVVFVVVSLAPRPSSVMRRDG